MTEFYFPMALQGRGKNCGKGSVSMCKSRIVLTLMGVKKSRSNAAIASLNHSVIATVNR